MAGGRPSKYDPAFCEQVIEFMTAGYSKMAAAGQIGICYNTLRAWMDEHPEFLKAVKLGEAARTMKLEGDLLSAETGPQVTSRIFALKNAAPDEWKDKHHSELTGKDGGAIETKETGAGAAKLAAFLDGISERSRAAGDPADE